jgi:succinoglycan biosynthesis transport protein ExoP
LSIFSRSSSTALTLALPEPNLAAIPEQAPDQGMSVAQFIAILLAYWMQIAVITVLTACLAAVAIKSLPKTYTATATLIVNSDVKDPLAGRDFPVEMIGNYVSTQIELMTSPIVLVPVLHQLNLMSDKNFSGGLVGSSEAVQAAVQKNLANSINVERGTGGQLLYVSASAKSAAKAADIANAVADVYIDQDRHRLNDPAAERAQRYTEELAELREKASVAQQKVTAFGKANGIEDMTSGTAGLEAQALEVLHQHLLETQNLRRSLEAKQVGLPSLDGPNGTTSSVLNSKTLLDAQLAQLAQLSSTYGPQHPKIVELKAQIALTRQAVIDEKHALSANSESQLTQAKELEHKYEQAIAQQEAKVEKVRQAQAEGSKLLLELDSAKAVYKQALDGFDQIMFQAVASHTNVSVVSRAVPPLRPSKPNKMKLMLVALVGSIGLGFAVPLGYGLFLARRLRCRDDMERDFGIAVLAQLDIVPALGAAK